MCEQKCGAEGTNIFTCVTMFINCNVNILTKEWAKFQKNIVQVEQMHHRMNHRQHDLAWNVRANGRWLNNCSCKSHKLSWTIAHQLESWLAQHSCAVRHWTVNIAKTSLIAELNTVPIRTLFYCKSMCRVKCQIQNKQTEILWQCKPMHARLCYLFSMRPQENVLYRFHHQSNQMKWKRKK